MRDNETVLAIQTDAGNNVYRQDHERLVQIHQKQITNDSLECASQQMFIPGQDQPDDQQEHRLELYNIFIANPLKTPGLK